MQVKFSMEAYKRLINTPERTGAHRYSRGCQNQTAHRSTQHYEVPYVKKDTVVNCSGDAEQLVEIIHSRRLPRVVAERFCWEENQRGEKGPSFCQASLVACYFYTHLK